MGRRGIIPSSRQMWRRVFRMIVSEVGATQDGYKRYFQGKGALL